MHLFARLRKKVGKGAFLCTCLHACEKKWVMLRFRGGCFCSRPMAN